MEVDKLLSKTIDWLRFVLAASVVLLHTGSLGADSSYPVYSKLCILFPQGICRLAVPIFFFISGFLFFKGLETWDSSIWKKKIKHRFYSLVLPYLLWNIIAAICIISYSLLRTRIGSLEPIPISTFWKDWGGFRLFWNCDKGMPLDYPLWFIRNLTIFVALTPLIYICIRKTHCCIVVLISILHFWGLSSALEGLLFFTTGAFFSIKRVDVLKLFHIFRLPAFILSIFFLIGLIPTYKDYPEIYRICKGLFVIFGSIATFNIVSRGISNNILKVNPFLANMSFFIFASHGILILHDFARYIILHILPGEGEWWYCIELFLRPCIAIGICIVIYVFLNKLSPTLLSILNGHRITTH